MTREKMEATVSRLEEFGARNPKAYRMRVGLMAALGYGYVWMVLAIVLALILGLVWAMFSLHTINFLLIKIGLLFLVAAIAIIRSLWVTFPRPEGIPVAREQAPELFAMLDELCTSLKVPRFHNVLLDTDFDAAVMQRPKLGLFGWQENYLVLGLPLLQALIAQELRAVVAHEVGHLSGNYSRFAGWVYRVAATWEQLGENLANQGNHGAWVFEKFYDWYRPHFNAYSFVLRRADEYVADRSAAQFTRVQVAGDALINVHIKGHFLESQFWPDLLKGAETEAEPPRQAFSRMARAFRENILPRNAHTWAVKALREEANFDDTHPSLTQRLAALGYLPVDHAPENFGLPVTDGESAASYYLRDFGDEAVKTLDEKWRTEMSEAWVGHHTYSQESRTALTEIEARITAVQAEGKPATDVLTEEEMWNRARWTAAMGDKSQGIHMHRQLLEAYPEHEAGSYSLGHLLLAQDSDEGIQVLEAAIRKQPAGGMDACVAIHGYLKEQGRKAEAEPYRDRVEAFYRKGAGGPTRAHRNCAT